MIKRTIGAVAGMCGGTLLNDKHADRTIVGITTDSRRVQPGQLFIPIIGGNFDGHAFGAKVLEDGAAALLWQSDHPVGEALANAPLILVDDTLAALQQLAAAYREELNLRVIGITGSNGKTTTKDMVASVLSGFFRVHKTEGNLNNHIGLPLTVLQLDETVEVVVLEMGMSGFGEIELLTGIGQPDIAIITNIGDAHMLQLGSREGIAKAKLEIASGLRAGGLLLINGDEPLLRSGIQDLKIDRAIDIQTFGLQEGSDWTAINLEGDALSASFDVEQDDQLSQLKLPVPGHHNVSNALAAIGAAKRLGVPAAQIRAGFNGLRLTGMRIEPLRAYNGAMLLNDAYNANPTAVRAAVDLVAQLTGYRRRWIVLGDMKELGPQEVQLHEEIGRYITPAKAEAVVTFGSLSEHTASAAQTQFKKDGTDASAHSANQAEDAAVKAFQNKNELIEWLRAKVAPEDLVLVKGSRSMRMEEIIHALQRV
ncbi:UDP-N-acetylmuramoyl-tripeptide--D-alanyl-D-alanine ligase [Paenibacillus baekrokdamisoli]|uniref:UDP-N-acetylmuramoyl-tripeptide--D-alanyl-D-alanine ligase n=1 Tax=Paenibacillus baekrokdamisoli TaxID=1712516 RepID=A0A3G9IYK4_9BACL|nr:UDP-N-acetylmuramoyl-tripeptide--D-alanyl-D-alanine ligase [Paenibacillus baekrokdamisoli]MBB3070220.1 UDP-N-acetylmuramoyl-tripeptide--D-alanyl-D-alanine ligase [Paenibacillus baekrokdamisoli]BBH21225.1 UDP-N-acetylmuramoyl-tripeptide--D-alanyl-D-alanine ligase [Paenibacillus baekrokdamisoli]